MSDWIKVGDRLPPSGVEVLIYNIDYPDEDIDIDEISPYGDWIENYVTHWMPLPEPPKDELDE